MSPNCLAHIRSIIKVCRYLVFGSSDWGENKNIIECKQGKVLKICFENPDLLILSW